MRRRLHQLGWGFGDQAVSSATNFIVGIFVARSVSAHSFGAFSLAFATYVLAIGACRALTSEPFMVRFSASAEEEWRRGARDAVGTAAVVSVAIAVLCFAIGSIAHGPFALAMYAVGAGMPGFLLQDTWRFIFFARQRGRDAFVNDTLCCLMTGAGLAVLAALDHRSLSAIVLVWGGAATLASAAGAVQGRVVPRVKAAGRWWRETIELAPRFLAEFVAMTGAASAAFYGVGVVAGLTVSGYLRAAEMLLSPFRIVMTGVALFALPEAVRVARSSPARLPSACARLGIALAVLATLYGLAIFLAPLEALSLIVGSLARNAQEVILPMAVATAMLGLTMGALIGLRALQAAKHSLMARLVATPFILAAPLVGAALGGAVAAAIGFAIAYVVGTTAYWWRFRLALGEGAFDATLGTPVAPRLEAPAR
jgi:O-antigen/teichoic acid export membrane protein